MAINHFVDMHFHFIGIGGIGMCGLAELMHKKGAVVSGSDLGESEQVKRLRELGIKISIGHDAKNTTDADVVVYSSAIKKENVEMVEAKTNEVPTISRAEALSELMRLKRGIAIAGTHGKTTTSSLLASVFLAADRDPTVVIGGKLQELGSTAVLGKGEWFVAEADESDGSFFKLFPEIVVITNVDNDHLDHYGSFENLKKSFYEFAEKIPFYGKVLVCGDDPIAYELFKKFSKKIKFYGFAERNDYQVNKTSSGNLELFNGSDRQGEFKLSLPGDYNVLNAVAALSVALEVGLDFSSSVLGIENFSGVGRRAEWKGVLTEEAIKGIDIYDDYAHHPTEIQAVLKGFKEKYPSRRIVSLFQPHRYTRTESCWDNFLQSFSDTDMLLISDVYPAGEKPIEGISSKEMFQQVKHQDKKYIIGQSIDERAKEVKPYLKKDDIFITLGAGDGWRVGEHLLKLYSE